MGNIQLWNYGLESLMTWKLSSMIESRIGNFLEIEDNFGKYNVLVQNWEILSQGASKRRIVPMEELEH